VSDTHAQSPAPRVHWPAFTLGVLTGLTFAAAVLVSAVLAQRANRRSGTTGTRVDTEDPISPSDQVQSDNLDQELSETFPASDPLPYSHRVD
jgi:hypothetical protein